MLAKNWWLCTQLAACACNICFRVALSSIVPAHFPNQISKGSQLKSQKHGWGCGLSKAKKYNYDVKTAFYTPLVCLSLVLSPSGRQSQANCIRVATSRVQIVPAWPPVACKFRPILFMFLATGSQAGTICMQLAATRVQIISDWRPLGYNLYAIGRRSHANLACVSLQLHAKLPVFCKHAARTIIWIKIWRRQ